MKLIFKDSDSDQSPSIRLESDFLRSSLTLKIGTRRRVFVKKRQKSLELSSLFGKNLNFFEIKIDRIFYYEDFSSRLVSDLKSRFEYAYKDQIFTISSILDPNYVMIWIPIEDRLYRRTLADQIAKDLFLVKKI